MLHNKAGLNLSLQGCINTQTLSHQTGRMQQKKSKYTKYEVQSCLNITIMMRTLGSETHTHTR
jgi:hypothetical protein